MKRISAVCTALILALVSLAAGASAEGGSWSQINQSVTRGADWRRFVNDP